MTPEQQQDVEVKLGLGVKVNVLQKHVQQLTGKLVTNKDLHNLRQAMRSIDQGQKNKTEIQIVKSFYCINIYFHGV